MARPQRITETPPLWAALLLTLLSCVAVADDPAPAQSQQLEPIDFIDNVKPRPNEMPNRPTELPPPMGWGFTTFSADSRFLATISVVDSKTPLAEVKIWNLSEPNQSVSFEQPARIQTAAFSPDGQWLALGPYVQQANVELLDSKTGNVAFVLPGMAARTNAIAWSSDGRQLALASTVDRSVRVWDVVDKKLLKVYEPEASKLFAVAFNAAGQLFAAGTPLTNGDGLSIFDLSATEPPKVLKGLKEMVEAAVFTSDGSQLISVGWDAMVRVWQVETGEETSVIKGHRKGVRVVATSGDGKRLVSANEREFKLWNGEKKELMGDLGPENSGARFVAMSADGNWLASLDRDGVARVWEVEKQSEKLKLERGASPAVTETNPAQSSRSAEPSGEATEPEALHALAYSHDGHWIALAREDGRISLRQASDGRFEREFEGFTDVVSCVVFSPDDRHIAAGSFDKSIRIWNVASGELVAELKGHSNWVFSLAFTADGNRLASGSYDKTVKLWNLADGKEITSLSGHTAGVRTVCFTPDGLNLISGSADRTAVVWSLTDFKPVATLKGHAAAIRAVACSPDGSTVATASEDATVKLWKTADWTERASLPGADGVMFWCVAFSPAGRTVAAGAFDGSVKLFDPVTGKERKTLRGATEAITAVAFAPGAREVIGSSVDKKLHRWKSETGAAAVEAARKADGNKAPELKPTEATTALNALLLKSDQPILSLLYSKQGKQLLVGGGLYRAPGSLQLWDLTRHEKIWQTDPFQHGLPGIAFSTDEKRIAIGNFADNFIRLIDAGSGKQLKEIRGHRGKVTAVAFAPDGKTFATGSLDREVKLWDASSLKELKTFSGHSDVVYSVAFSTDGARLLSGSYDRTARIWDVQKGGEVALLKGHQGTIQQAVYSHDGTLIATASSDRTVRIHDAATGDYRFTLRGHSQKVESVAFAPNGKLIATGSADKTIRFWNPISGTEILKLTQEGTVRAVAFSPDGNQLATGCDDKTVKLWDVSVLGRNDTPATDATSK